MNKKADLRYKQIHWHCFKSTGTVSNPLALFQIPAENHSDKNARIGPNRVLQYLKK